MNFWISVSCFELMSRKCRSEMCSGSRVMKLNIQLPIPFTRRDGGKWKTIMHMHCTVKALNSSHLAFSVEFEVCTWQWSTKSMELNFAYTSRKISRNLISSWTLWKIDMLPMFAIGSREGKLIARPFAGDETVVNPLAAPWNQSLKAIDLLESQELL